MDPKLLVTIILYGPLIGAAVAGLVGKRIGTPEYQMTAPVWIRGILADDYAVPVDSVTYVTGGAETPACCRMAPLSYSVSGLSGTIRSGTTSATDGSVLRLAACAGVSQ